MALGSWSLRRPRLAPFRRREGVGEVERFTRYLVAAKLHDLDVVQRFAPVIAEQPFRNPEVARASDLLRPEIELRGVALAPTLLIELALERFRSEKNLRTSIGQLST